MQGLRTPFEQRSLLKTTAISKYDLFSFLNTKEILTLYDRNDIRSHRDFNSTN